MPTTLPTRSSTGHDHWTFDAELGVFRAPTPLGVPELCWGDRHVRPQQRAPGQVRWVGTTSGEGRCGVVRDFAAALAFVRGADFTEAGCGLWSQLLDTDKVAAVIVALHRRDGQLAEPRPFRTAASRRVPRIRLVA